jgi:hypothetical protein
MMESQFPEAVATAMDASVPKTSSDEMSQRAPSLVGPRGRKALRRERTKTIFLPPHMPHRGTFLLVRIETI